MNYPFMSHLQSGEQKFPKKNVAAYGRIPVNSSKQRGKSSSVTPQTTATLSSIYATSSGDCLTNELSHQHIRSRFNTASRCEACKHFDVKRVKVEWFSFTIAQLLASEKSCDGCAVLVAILKPYKFHSKTSKIGMFHGPKNTLRLGFLDHNSFPYKLDIFGSLVKSKNCPWNSLSPLSQLRSHENRSMIYQIQQWLEECDRAHAICMPSSPRPMQLPTRVLHIVGHRKVRLLVTDGTLRARYACLSHCWGQGNPTRTTNNNIHKFKQEIPWSQLPKTFKQAIAVTRRLGLQYLWIDSLCIIQDDTNDWRHEGTKMASTYTHAYITLAATNSSDAHGGLHPDDPPVSRLRSYQFKLKENTDSTYSLNVVSAFSHRQFVYEIYPLMKRAWVFQERLLSPRIVHFAKQEMYWECNMTTTCECGEYWTEVPTWRSGDRIQKPKFASIFKKTKLNVDEKIKRSALTLTWHQIVSSYSELALAHDSDVFPALQGIVRSLQNVQKCAYYAGVWKDSAFEDLLWYYNSPVATRCDRYRAPTWSWASQKSRVWWLTHNGHDGDDERDFFPTARIIEISTRPVGDDSTGELSSGHLMLKGKIVSLLSVAKEVKPWSAFNIHVARQTTEMLDAGFYFDIEIDPQWEGRVSTDLGPVPMLLMMELGWLGNPEGGLPPQSKVWILLEKADPRENIYRRVGIAVFTDYSGFVEEELLVKII